ncbi:Bile salt sulfotransferase like protein [Argiope bruennichi]|uniref:Bile salt sulfotransferase like protein n=1 Tax=Argiope bruennichi TaxID=94029 RepID=A0A8T0FD02_ARGBR|nr:Bile salt sulfotransferase like protein [Argiope bruennichi]
MSRFQVIKGIPFSNVHWFKKENIEGTIDYYPKDGDISIASYPKTGTTWLQYIVLQITSEGDYFPPFDDLHVKTFMEMAGPEVIDSLEGVRIYKHHYRYDMVKKNPKSKVLYIYRNPEDTFVSYFHFMENVREEKLNFEEFFEGFLSGNIEYGSYFEHVLSFLNHKDDDNLLLISYEKLHANPREEILRISRFLGEEYYQGLLSDELLLSKILKNTSFEHMKKNRKFNLPHNSIEESSEKHANNINLFRKGIIGDGKSLLSEEQMCRLREKLTEIMKDTEVFKEWIKQQNNFSTA